MTRTDNKNYAKFSGENLLRPATKRHLNNS